MKCVCVCVCCCSLVICLTLYLQGHSNVKLQLAATFCISNLIWNEEDGKGQNTQVEGGITTGARFREQEEGCEESWNYVMYAEML